MDELLVERTTVQNILVESRQRRYMFVLTDVAYHQIFLTDVAHHLRPKQIVVSSMHLPGLVVVAAAAA